MAGKLGLREVVAMGVGGMVSGGIYAVLGVAMKQAGNAVPLSFLLAGIITLLTAYSYIKLTLHFGEDGGAFSFIKHVVENNHVAGLLGWILVVGYIGVMAMYAFAFGSYILIALRQTFAVGLPQILRPVISVVVVGTFVGINLVGVKASGLYEDVAVYLKILLLLILAGLGILFFRGDPLQISFFNRGMVSPVAAFAIIFVSYEGFQLLCYDYRDIKDVDWTLPKGMFIAILIAIAIYMAVSFMATLHLTPEQLIQHKETALATAVSNIPLLGGIGFVLVILSAIKSTSSGINATLFGASRLAHRIATENELPKIFSFRNHEGIPVYSLVIMGSLTALFSALGTLEQITEFGSVAFLVADGAANYANLRLYEKTNSRPLIPLVGLIGTAVALPIVLLHLYLTEPHILLSIGGIFGGLLLLELFYLEREEVEEAAKTLEIEIVDGDEK